ncbi:MAG: hypothetical protein GY851_09945, partial [bacterium]|nr:hypothetical protein [bacterium]
MGDSYGEAKIRVYSGSLTNERYFADRGPAAPYKNRIYLHGGDITMNSTSESQRRVPFRFNSANSASQGAHIRFYFDPDGTGVLNLRNTDLFGQWNWMQMTNQMVANEPRWWIYDPLDPLDGGSPCTATSLLFTATTIGGIEFTRIRMGGPIVDNANGATDVTLTNAWLNGTLYPTPREEYAVYVYWGDNDGGMDPGSWDDHVLLGTNITPHPADLGAYVDGRGADTLYYYRYCASNENERAWALETTTFAVAPVKLGVVDGDAAEEGEDAGTFMVSRSAALTGGDLLVGYSIGGLADGGED